MSQGSTLTSKSTAAPNKPARRSYSDVLMIAGVAAIVSLMIVPLDTTVIDALVAVNISIGLSLVLIALYIPSPVAFSSFPSVLLLTTLFRLSLGIATTRVILLHASGGHIIETFGKLGAGGNLIVGIVVFLIITIVQFIVIAKGAERVAEVAARFTLDAMPGKQLSIDSDLRSGMLDKDEARKRRRLLEVESQLYGSLDGAMKFVKGDAIAGIVIIVVNLLGGLGVGVLQHGLSFGQAVETYSILTIGDGLVSQIPALLASIAAGLIVTRTTGEEDDAHLGAAVGRQFLAQPKVLLITGLIALLLTLVPGFPKVVFMLLGVALTTAGLRLMPGTATRLWHTIRRREMPLETPADGRAVVPVTEELRLVAPLLIDLPDGAAALLASPELGQKLAQVREAVHQALGVVIPSIDLRLTSQVPAGRFRVSIFEVTAAEGDLPETDVPAFLAARLGSTLRRQAAQFLGIQEVNSLMTRMGREYPDLVKEVLRVIPLQKVADVLRRLVEEQVSVRNLRDVFESLADAGQREKDPASLAEYARIGLKRWLSERYAGTDRVLRVVLLHPELEERMRQSLRGTGPGAQVALDPDTSRQIGNELEALRSAAAQEAAGPAVLLTPIELRRPLRRLIENDYPEMAVLSYQELAADIRVQPVGQLAGKRQERVPPPGVGFDPALGSEASKATPS